MAFPCGVSRNFINRLESPTITADAAAIPYQPLLIPLLQPRMITSRIMVPITETAMEPRHPRRLEKKANIPAHRPATCVQPFRKAAKRVTPPRDRVTGLSMKSITLGSLAGLVLAAATALSQDPTPPASPSPSMSPSSSPAATEVAVITTSEGEMVAEFWPEVAPNTVENFKKLARQGFYDGTAFHRIVKGFMIQGGDPLTKDPSKESRWGTGDPGYKVKAEFNKRSHERGVLSMARSSDPDSAGSQFFICLANVNRLDGQYTTFGKVIKGDDVLAKLGEIETAMSASGEKSKPTRRVAVESIKIVPADSVK